jgi:predicted nucleic acid-binding protein
MLTIDTSALLALTNRRDPNHERTVKVLEATPPPYFIPTAILSEIAYMLESRGRETTLLAVLADVESGYYDLDCGDRDVPRLRHLMGRYADLPLGLADASVVACAERHGGTILSHDRDIWVVAREGAITVLPS